MPERLLSTRLLDKIVDFEGKRVVSEVEDFVLHHPPGTIIFIQGESGMGKTTFAMQLGDDLAQRFETERGKRVRLRHVPYDDTLDEAQNEIKKKEPWKKTNWQWSEADYAFFNQNFSDKIEQARSLESIPEDEHLVIITELVGQWGKYDRGVTVLKKYALDPNVLIISLAGYYFVQAEAMLLRDEMKLEMSRVRAKQAAKRAADIFRKYFIHVEGLDKWWWGNWRMGIKLKNKLKRMADKPDIERIKGENIEKAQELIRQLKVDLEENISLPPFPSAPFRYRILDKDEWRISLYRKLLAFYYTEELVEKAGLDWKRGFYVVNQPRDPDEIIYYPKEFLEELEVNPRLSGRLK